MSALFKYLLVGTGFLFVGLGNLNAAFLPLYLERCDGLHLEKQQDYFGALVHFKVLLALLEYVQTENPMWEHDLVAKDAADSKAKIAELEPKASEQIIRTQKPDLSETSTLSLLYDEAVKESDSLKAMHEFEEYHSTLLAWHNQDPQWQEDLIQDRIKKSQELIAQLAPKVLKDAWPVQGPGHTIQ